MRHIMKLFYTDSDYWSIKVSTATGSGFPGCQGEGLLYLPLSNSFNSGPNKWEEIGNN